MFDALQMLIDYQIPYWTEGKNTQAGWININCPFCNDYSNHGGFNIAEERYNCWLCGWHPLTETIQAVISCNYQTAHNIKEEYTTNQIQIALKKKIITSNKSEIKLPFETMEKKHRQYLIKRNFDPDKLERTWNLRGSGYTGRYKFRIIAPITLNNKIVSYQGRDITERAPLKYKACKIEDEVVHHKHILYGIDKVKNKQAIIVEGITDVWRLGAGAVATFGIAYTEKQVLFAAKHLDRVFILFDNESTAREKSRVLAIQLLSFGINAEIIEVTSMDDPATLSQENADYLIKHFLGKS